MPQGEGSDAAILTGLLGPFVAAGAPFLLFGGWAEELSGLRPPGPHGDIDLLLLAPRFAQLENLLTLSAGFREIRAKRFAHKRAWIGPSGVMVEFLLVTYEPGR